MNGGLPRWIDEGYRIETNSTGQDNESEVPKGDAYPLPSMNESVIRCKQPSLDLLVHFGRLLMDEFQSLHPNGVKFGLVTN